MLRILTFTGLLALPLAAADKIDFNHDIRPILSDKCFFCHGPDEHERKAGLRLDVREEALKDNDGVRAIVPGDLKASEMVHRMRTTDKDELMPPEESHKHLTKAEIELLERWIKEGAEYKGQWIYEKPIKADPPRVTGSTPIDKFIRADLAERRLKSSPETDKVTLLRRLSFDLTGLPPTLDDVVAFESDKGKDAYEKQVDRLLASPAYGERMAAKWLDLVRYADTVGFHGDQNVSQSPYRDYVIDAFNSNMRYDQFTRENLAGDLLPNPTIYQKVASGYNRLNMTTEEGGAQPKEYLAKYAGDRVRNVSAVWMGATLGCAECHDHKYDPYKMSDFYSFAAFFADLQEVGKYGARKRPPEITVPPREGDAKSEALRIEIAALKKQLGVDTPEIKKARAEWATAQKAEISKGPVVDDIFFVEEKLAKGIKPEGTWTYVGKDKGNQVRRGSTSRLQQNGALVQHFFQNRKAYNATGEEVFFSWIYLDPKNPPKTVMIQINNGDWNHRGYWGEDKIPFGAGNGPDHKRMGDLPKTGEWVRLEVPAKLVNINKGNNVVGLAFTQFGGKAWWDDSGVSTTSAMPESVVAAIKAGTPDAKPVVDYYSGKSPLLAKLRKQISDREGELSKLNASAPTMPISVAVNPRVMRVLPRGNWMDESGEIVQPAIPTFLGKLETGDKRATRLDLANWFVSGDNPMTSRTFVNHLWHMFFGAGISNVLSDLGNQGEPPMHPELLDWLAVEFVDSGWDIKHIVKTIVMSETYRQSSLPTQDLSLVDPYNRLLSRQSPRRLTAEMVRDNALAVSGLMVNRIGGRSVHPYQPAGHYAQLNFPRRTYKHSTDDNQWRRAVYSHWQRTFLHPTMLAFDAPSREACTAQRPVSNTPLQALALMNDPTFVEAARTFAERMVARGGKSPEAILDYACKTALQRPPTAKQKTVLLGLYNKHKAEYAKDAAAAKALLNVGDRPEGAGDVSELAAWTSVARVILNLSETITRN